MPVRADSGPLDGVPAAKPAKDPASLVLLGTHRLDDGLLPGEREHRQEPAQRPETRTRRKILTITLGGDLGLNGHGVVAKASGASKHGKFLGWGALTAGVRPLLDGDVNFANLETVVSADDRLKPIDKAFNFRSHPEGVRHLAEMGFNLLSTANNHAVDFGLDGMRETIGHLERLRVQGRILAHAGVGLDREDASRPRVVSVKGQRIALAAVGIDSGGRAGRERPGMMAWRANDDVEEVLARLRKATAGYRILSVHQGVERDVTADRDAIRKLRHEAVLGQGVDLVVGHHAHVVQGVEMVDGRLIFYGLGNLLHPGMQNMGGFGICQDYGLFARVHLAQGDDGRLRAVAVEAVPLTDMHWRARPMKPESATLRIHVLNHISAQLDDPSSGAKGVRFRPLADGRGLYCLPEGREVDGVVGSLCRTYEAARAPSAGLKARIKAACQPAEPVVATVSARRAEKKTRWPAPFARPANRDWVGGVFSGN